MSLLEQPKTEALLEIDDLIVEYKTPRLFGNRPGVRAVDGVSLSIAKGEVLGIVGESGCGKSTVAKAVVRLLTPQSGRIRFAGRDVTSLGPGKLASFRKGVQLIFQDPGSSLNPRQRIDSIVGEPLIVIGYRGDTEKRVRELLDLVGLSSRMMKAYPHEISGGQRQRVGIARALAVEPKLIVCDEPTAALDVSVQAQVLNLLTDLRNQFGLSCMFISHNLPAVASFAHRVAVMYLGRIVEVLPSADLASRARHPYTLALLNAIPMPNPRIEREKRSAAAIGEPPRLPSDVLGCKFWPRCPLFNRLGSPSVCQQHEPPLTTASDDGNLVRCHFSLDAKLH